MAAPTTVDPNAEYGALEPQDIHSAIASIRDIKSWLFTPLEIGRYTLYLITAQTMTAIRASNASGQVPVPAGGTLTFGANLPRRMLSYEVWNYDAGNGLTLSIQATTGGTRAPVYIAPNTYYTSDINAPADTTLTLSNTAGAPVLAQIKVNGF